MEIKTGFIGIGNMGGALLRAVCEQTDGKLIAVCDREQEKMDAACAQYGCAARSATEIAETARYIFLCVKPQAMASMLAEIREALARRRTAGDRFVLISIAAGLKIETIRKAAGGEYPVIRIMPNIPAAVGEGMLLYTPTPDVTDAECADFLQFMEKSGKLDRIEENLMDVGCALNGCAPAFVSMFAEALADGAVACGLPRQKALLYAEQTLLGTAKYLMETGVHPAVMKDAVSSPAGTTIQGVRALEEKGFRGACMDAVIAAFQRSVALGRTDDEA